MAIEDYVDPDFWDYNELEKEPYNVKIQAILLETKKAWQVQIGIERHWLPKSQCTIKDNIVTMPYWLAKKKNLN